MDIPEKVTDLINLDIPKHRRIWRPLMEKYNCQKIAEIGVFRGENFQLMIEHKPEVAIAVDLWKDDGNIARNDCGFTQEQLDEQFECFRASVMNKPFVDFYRDYSENVAKDFEDNYFDLIYIDADHTYEGCKADIEAWYPKMKSGGFFTGDDYSQGYKASRTKVPFGVVEAVNEFAEANNLKVYELPRHGWCIIKP